jgi:hypothetical protein
MNVTAAEVDLETGHPGQRAGRGTDFGGEVGQGADVIAEDCRGVGELGAGQLHPVARVARQADSDRLQLDGLTA